MPERLLVPQRSPAPPVLVMQDEAAELRLLPPPSGTVVRRERLLRLLDAAARRRVTLVVGPAGYGKTTLLSQWVAWNRSRHVAWLGLHPNDDDPVRLQRRFRAAMEPIVGTVGAVGAVGTGEGDFDGQHRPGELPLVLVLDDVEAISNRTLCQRLAADLDAMPLLRFILVSRADPFAPGSRFQLGHPIVELRRRDLAFDRWEAQELLTRLSRKPLSDAHIDALLERTDGCAANLQLAALSLRSVDDVDEFVTSFAVDDRHAADVLTERLLENQTPEVQRFLLRTSVLERMSGPLCDFVARTTDGQAILDRLERSSMPVTPLDERRVWFRLHRLPRVLLRQHLRARDPAAERQLLERAAAWYFAHNGVTEALNCLAEAGSWDDLAGAILRNGPSMLLRGQAGMIAKWVGLLPSWYRGARPTLVLLEAADRLWCAPAAARHSAARRLASLASLSAANRTAAAALQAMWQLDNGALGRAIVFVDRFLDEEAALPAPEADDLLALPGMHDLLVGSAHLVRSAVLIEMGDLTGARDALAPAFEMAVPIVDVQGLGLAAMIAALGGRLRLADRTANRALALADECGFAEHRVLGAPLLALAQVARERDAVVEAGRMLDLAEQYAAPTSLVGKLVVTERAELELTMGRFDEAQALIALCRE